MGEMNLYFRTWEERNYGKELSGYLQLYVIKVADNTTKLIISPLDFTRRRN